MELDKFKQRAKQHAPANKKLLGVLRKMDQRDLDERFHTLHEEVFAHTDCLQCANCCKTTSPIFKDRDIDRIARRLKIKPSKLVDDHLRLDEDGDYVLKTSPCVFLEPDNTCRVYEDRPAACREYPHTNRRKMFQLLDLSLKNTLVCPAVEEIFARLRRDAGL